MSHLVLKYEGTPFAILLDSGSDSVQEHIRNGYEEYVEYLDAGKITGEVVADVSGITVSLPPPTEMQITDKFLKVLLTDRFELENRIRVLEGKAEITRAQFIAALKTKLGI